MRPRSDVVLNSNFHLSRDFVYWADPMETPTLTSAEVLTYSPTMDDLDIDRLKIARDLGYRRTRIPDNVSGAIDEVLRSAPGLLDLRCGCVILPPGSVSIGDESARCGSGELRMAGVIAPLLRDSVTLALFVVTAGPRLERWASELLRGEDPVRGFVADTIASEVVECAANWLEGKLSLFAARYGWQLTNRYSPGYCGWPTSDQHALFSLLPGGFCDVRLTESALMVPVKSISGVIGLGPDVHREGYQCAICDMQDCFRRRT